jgi:hypothetical protein
MVLDPLTALSLAGTVVQFVDFSSKILSNTQQFYARGSLSANDELELITTNLNDIFVKLKRPHHTIGAIGCNTRSEQQLLSICDASTKIADGILRRLEKLKLKGVPGDGNNGFEIVCKSLKAMWSRKDLVETLSKLEKYQLALNTFILIELR